MLRHRLTSIAAVLVVTAAGVALGPAPAQAAPPPNDLIQDAVTLTVPSTVTVDTTEATATRGDGRCVLGSNVWYRVRPTTTGPLRMTTAGSDYDTVLALFRGPRNNRTLLGCNDDSGGLFSAMRRKVQAGKTYWIALSSCCSRDASGGSAVLRIFRDVEPTDVSVTVDTAESGGVSGRLLLSGSVVCAQPSGLVWRLVASQRVGSGVARATFFDEGECGTTPGPWQARLDSETGWAFQPGDVSVQVFAQARDGFTRATDEQDLVLTATDNPTARVRP